MELSFIGHKKDAPNDARQVRSRNALCGALLELLQEMPFDQLTIREITARAGTGYATFFRHYPTKEALLGDVASEEIGNLLTMTATMLFAEERYRSVVAMCEYVDAHRKLWSALLTGGAAGMVREEMLRQTRRIAEEDHPCPPWLPSDLAVVFGVGASLDIVTWWLHQDNGYAPDRIATILDRLVLAPLLAGTSGLVAAG